jgi:hypothetical protein
MCLLLHIVAVAAGDNSTELLTCVGGIFSAPFQLEGKLSSSALLYFLFSFVLHAAVLPD